MHFILYFAKCALFAQIYLKAPLPFPYSALLHYYGKFLNHHHFPSPKRPNLKPHPQATATTLAMTKAKAKAMAMTKAKAKSMAVATGLATATATFTGQATPRGKPRLQRKLS